MLICELCGTAFPPPVPAYGMPKRFCSKKCQERSCAIRELNKKRKQPEIKICEYCGNTFSTARSTQRFCSALHRYEMNNIQSAARGRRKRADERPPTVCRNCGKVFLEKHRLIFCSVKCCSSFTNRNNKRDRILKLLRSKGVTIPDRLEGMYARAARRILKEFIE